ncbi:centrosomal protein of 290 kDa-like isoform X1 [Chiloscyllium plagiosum]|uniref:centrosomal protein of 290 kDa-like isoform X1 n=2 Tax=Chiloscyllium plagiosum TaxID=36176 RepID=UPI001CB7FD0D|nr:centrosomal protein of 290 kDa-like isoform X1 [Chiloscyllium plagiosum]XP_043543682.1 centrosomal protein of 290 kDa-like isoform X1 [Chiloscyllium plagiosum]
MDMPPVHRCMQLFAENEHIQRKLKKLRLKNEQLERELSEVQGKLQMQQLMRDFVTTRDAQIQTEPQPWHKGGVKEGSVSKADERSNRLLQMYNALQKRYEKEIKTNKEQSEIISNLTMNIHELELQLVTSKQRIQQLEHPPTVRRRKTPTPEHGITSPKHQSDGKRCCSPDCIHTELLLEIERLQKDKNKLIKERRNLKNELAGLDKGFFEEIEDLKYALQESAKLNKEYEKCLRAMCEKCGLPFPETLCPVTTK